MKALAIPSIGESEAAPKHLFDIANTIYMLSVEQSLAVFKRSQQWLEYLAERECERLRDQHCLDSDKGAIIPKEVRQLPADDFRRLLFKVGSSQWRRISKAATKVLTQQAIEALADHPNDWLLPMHQLAYYIEQHDGYTTEHGISIALPLQTMSVERYEAVEGKIRPFDEWLMRLANVQTDCLRDTQCGPTADRQFPSQSKAAGPMHGLARGEAKHLPANCLRRLLFTNAGTKKVKLAVLAIYRRIVIGWLLDHIEDWLGISEDQVMQ